MSRQVGTMRVLTDEQRWCVWENFVVIWVLFSLQIFLQGESVFAFSPISLLKYIEADETIAINYAPFRLLFLSSSAEAGGIHIILHREIRATCSDIIVEFLYILQKCLEFVAVCVAGWSRVFSHIANSISALANWKNVSDILILRGIDASASQRGLFWCVSHKYVSLNITVKSSSTQNIFLFLMKHY